MYVQFEPHMARIAEDDGWAKSNVDDSRMFYPLRSQVCDPSLQFVSVLDSERQVIEAHASFIERIG